MKSLILPILFGFFSPSAFASTGHFEPIDTCYHWLEPYQLQSKIAYAKNSSGALKFYNDMPIYCWRSPLGAYSTWETHGDELIRIKFKPGVINQVVHRARYDNLNQMAPHPVIYSNDNSWQEYTITPEAVESWSVYQPQLIEEMKAEMAFYLNSKVTQNDLFYPINAFAPDSVVNAISIIIGEFKKKSHNEQKIFGDHPENHFLTEVNYLPWQGYLDLATRKAMKGKHIIHIVSVTSAHRDFTEDAQLKCDGLGLCHYHTQGRKRVTVRWHCGDENQIQTYHETIFDHREHSVTMSCKKD